MLSTVIYDVDSLKLKAQVIADQLSLQSLSKKEALRSIKAREEGYYLKVEKLRCYLQLGLRSKTKPIYCNFSEWAGMAVPCLLGWTWSERITTKF